MMHSPLAFARPEPNPTPAPSKREALADIVRRAAAEARTAPERYLRETRVPGGGE